MKSIESGIRQPTTLTMLSGLAIIGGATLALGSMVLDQSGQSAAMVSKSFRAEMRASEVECELIPILGDAAQDSATTQPRLPGRLALSIAQLPDKTDPAREFANLLSELERVAGQCAIDAPIRGVRIHAANADLESVTAIINQACDLWDDAESGLSRDKMQVEIQTWAASPTPTAWIEAICEASRLRDKALQELSAANSPQISIRSSAALWPHASRVRPAMTIALRHTAAATRSVPTEQILHQESVLLLQNGEPQGASRRQFD